MRSDIPANLAKCMITAQKEFPYVHSLGYHRLEYHRLDPGLPVLLVYLSSDLEDSLPIALLAIEKVWDERGKSLTVARVVFGNIAASRVFALLLPVSSPLQAQNNRQCSQAAGDSCQTTDVAALPWRSFNPCRTHAKPPSSAGSTSATGVMPVLLDVCCRFSSSPRTQAQTCEDRVGRACEATAYQQEDQENDACNHANNDAGDCSAAQPIIACG